MLAEGRIGGPEHDKTYIQLLNPSAFSTGVQVRFQREQDSPMMKSFIIPANGRFTIDVGLDHVPEIPEGRFGVDIRSDAPIVVERSMYSDANGRMWAAGTNATGLRTPLLPPP